MSHEIPHQPTPLFLFKGKTKLSGGTTGQRSEESRRKTGFSEKQSQKSKWVVGEDLVTSKHSKVMVFPILLTWEANNMLRETQGREAELIRVSSGFAVDSSHSSSSGMVGSCQQGGSVAGIALLCGHWGCQTRGCGGTFPLSPSHNPACGFPGCAACREHQLHAGTAPHHPHTVPTLLVGFAKPVLR